MRDLTPRDLEEIARAHVPARDAQVVAMALAVVERAMCWVSEPHGMSLAVERVLRDTHDPCPSCDWRTYNRAVTHWPEQEHSCGNEGEL